MSDLLAGILAAGFGIFFIGTLFLGFIDFIGKIYGTYLCLTRKLTSEQRIIYILLVWIVPFGWLIYIVLGKNRTEELFSDIDIF